MLWSLVGTIFVGKIEKKQAILCLKCKSLIALLNLHKMIIKCVIMLISAEKRYSLCDIDRTAHANKAKSYIHIYTYFYNIYIFVVSNEYASGKCIGVKVYILIRKCSGVKVKVG